MGLKFDVNKFEKEEIPDNMLNFLYPHPIHTGIRNFYQILKILKQLKFVYN